MSDATGTGGFDDFEPAVSIVPGVSILGVLSNLNYAPWYALAEYVDNAIQSAARSYARLCQLEPDYQLHVDIAYSEHQGGHIAIVDNAGGIARRDFNRAFKAAEIPPRSHRSLRVRHGYEERIYLVCEELARCHDQCRRRERLLD